MISAILTLLAASTPPPKPSMKPLTAISPCAVVTSAEVRRVFKRPFAKSSEDTVSCEFSGLQEQVVAIKLQHSVARLDVEAEMLTLRKSFPDARLRDAKGFSTPAFFLDLPGIGTQLFVIRGDHDFLLVAAMGLGEAKKVSEPARQIAKLALDRLPTVSGGLEK